MREMRKKAENQTGSVIKSPDRGVILKLCIMHAGLKYFLHEKMNVRVFILVLCLTEQKEMYKVTASSLSCHRHCLLSESTS